MTDVGAMAYARMKVTKASIYIFARWIARDKCWRVGIGRVRGKWQLSRGCKGEIVCGNRAAYSKGHAAGRASRNAVLQATGGHKKWSVHARGADWAGG